MLPRLLGSQVSEHLASCSVFLRSWLSPGYSNKWVKAALRSVGVWSRGPDTECKGIYFLQVLPKTPTRSVFFLKTEKASDQALSFFLHGRVLSTHDSCPASHGGCMWVCKKLSAGGDPWNSSSVLSCLLLHVIGYFWPPKFNEHKAINKLNKYGTLRDDGGGGGFIAKSCPTHCDPMDCSLPGSSVPIGW